MVFKLFTSTRCAFCRKEIDHKDIREGRKYFCSGKHREEYLKQKETRKKALSGAGSGGGKGCCG